MTTKKCPYCAEEIQLEAIKCRFCGEFISEKADENSHQITKLERITVIYLYRYAQNQKQLSDDPFASLNFHDLLNGFEPEMKLTIRKMLLPELGIQISEAQDSLNLHFFNVKMISEYVDVLLASLFLQVINFYDESVKVCATGYCKEEKGFLNARNRVLSYSELWSYYEMYKQEKEKIFINDLNKIIDTNDDQYFIELYNASLI